MTQTNDQNTLRALIQLLPPARRMREDLTRMTQTEAYDGLGDVVLSSFQGLITSLARIQEDSFTTSLTPHLPEGATDKQKVWQAFLGSGQMVSYLEAQTGLPASEPSPPSHQQRSFHIGELHLPGVTSMGSISKMAEGIAQAVGEEE